MPLPVDFHDFIEPQTLRDCPDWLDLMPVGAGSAPYEYRFYVVGFRKAAASLGIYGVNQLWDLLSGVGQKKAEDNKRNSELIEASIQRILENVPNEWKAQIPDIHDRGKALAYNTYWRGYCKAQLLRTWRCQIQTLPKALLAISAIDLAMNRRGILWDQVMQATPVTIRPSVYWLVDYSRTLYETVVAPNERASYQACGLHFDVGYNKKSVALREASNGRSLTFSTVEGLQNLLRANSPPYAGGVRLIESRRRQQPAAQEVFWGV